MPMEPDELKKSRAQRRGHFGHVFRARSKWRIPSKKIRTIPKYDADELTETRMPMVFRSSLGAYADEDLAVLHFANDDEGYAARSLMNRERSLAGMPRDVNGPTMLIVPRAALAILLPLFAKDEIVPKQGAFLNTDALSNVAMAELRKVMLDA